MCNFLSALVFKSGEVYSAPEYTDSHTDLIDARGLSAESDKSIFIRGWMRVEFSPPSADRMADVDAYKLTVDETASPEWFDDAMRFSVTHDLRTKVESMIIDDERTIVLGGCWILASTAKIGRVVGATIKAILGSSRVGTILGSSRVGKMLGSSQVGTMWDSSRVGTILGSSRVGTMRDSSHVGEMLGSSQVGKMLGSSQVGTMWDSSRLPHGKSPIRDNRIAEKQS